MLPSPKLLLVLRRLRRVRWMAYCAWPWLPVQTPPMLLLLMMCVNSMPSWLAAAIPPGITLLCQNGCWWSQNYQ